MHKSHEKSHELYTINSQKTSLNPRKSIENPIKYCILLGVSWDYQLPLLPFQEDEILDKAQPERPGMVDNDHFLIAEINY